MTSSYIDLSLPWKHSGLFAVTDNRYEGYTVYDDAGEKIGTVHELFVNGNRTPRYLGVQTTPLGLRRTLVPTDIVVHVDERRQLIEVFEPKERLEHAPAFDGNEKITCAFEQQVRNFFGVVSER